MHANTSVDHAPVEVRQVDILIIGGGFAGTWAALRAAELGARVTLVEKAYVSRSGASTMSGGITTCPLADDDLQPWIEEFVTRGDYMCDQQWTRQLLQGQRDRVAALEQWGVPISRDAHGAIRRFSSRGMLAVRCMQYNPKLAMEALRRAALAQGVSILDRVSITELLTSDGAYPTRAAVVGAFGLDVKTGGRIVFSAKRTILATGQISMKGVNHVDNDTGDGVAMAWRVGARLADLEFSFGGTFSLIAKRYNLGSYNVAVAHGARLINVHGERFMQNYDPVRLERSELARVIAAFVKELEDGKGPVFLDLRHCDASYWKDLQEMASLSGGTVLLSDRIPDPRHNPIPIEPTWGLWSGGRGGIDIDLRCRTTVAGLYAAGATAKNPATGTHASAGAPTAFAMNSGYFAGEDAARQALAEPNYPQIPESIMRLREAEAFRPLRAAASSPIDADRLHDRLATLGGSVADLMKLNEAKLEQLIAEADCLHGHAMQATAGSLHDLVKVHEARNIAENARLIYRAALDRTESREQFYRSDYPETDDDAWFCLHAVTRREHGPVFERLPIPAHEADLTRPKKLARHKSPIAAIFAGTYDPAIYD